MDGDELSVRELLTTTRSVRRRLDLGRPVDSGIVTDCIDLALQAPVGGNLVRSRWLLVEDAQLRSQIADEYRSAYHLYMADRHTSGETDRYGERVVDSTDHLAAVLDQVPLHVIPCQFGRPPADGNVRELSSFYGSIMPAVWSFMLALRSRGLGSTLTTLHLGREREIAELLGIPDTVTQVALLPVAHTIGRSFRPARRRPATEVTYRNAWGRRDEATGR